MNAASVDIKDILDGESSLGLTFATDLFVGKEPETPDNCVTLFDTPGEPPDLTLAGKDEDDYNYPYMQVRVRDNSYTDGWDTINSIKTYLHGLHGVTQGGSKYDLIQCVQEPALLDWDKNDRVRFVTTFRIHRKEV